MSNWVRVNQEMHKSATETYTLSYFIPVKNIAGIGIRSDKPTQLTIMMMGDESPTPFNFNSVEERNSKLTELMRTEASATGKEVEPHDQAVANS